MRIRPYGIACNRQAAIVAKLRRQLLGKACSPNRAQEALALVQVLVARHRGKHPNEVYQDPSGELFCFARTGHTVLLEGSTCTIQFALEWL